MMSVKIVDNVKPGRMNTYWNVLWLTECIGWVTYNRIDDQFRFTESTSAQFYANKEMMSEIKDKAIEYAMNDVANSIIEKDILRS